MTTYLCQCTDVIVVDPTQQFISYLQNTYIIKNNNNNIHDNNNNNNNNNNVHDNNNNNNDNKLDK